MVGINVCLFFWQGVEFVVGCALGKQHLLGSRESPGGGLSDAWSRKCLPEYRMRWKKVSKEQGEGQGQGSGSGCSSCED